MSSSDRSGPTASKVLVLTTTRRPSRPAHASTILCGADATRRFLEEPDHHLLIAYDGDTPL
jgi:hypothetical protein